MRSLLFPLVAVGAAPIRDWAGFSFESYLEEFGKSHDSNQYLNRLALFEVELLQVVSQNEAYLSGESTWYAELNEFSDWTVEEFKQLKKGNSRTDSGSHPVARSLGAAANPTRKDWRDATPSVVTAVKDQGGCGSCWAFGSTEVMESHYAINTGELLTLAPQAYVNCAPNPTHCGGTGGCEGSIPELAFNTSAQIGLPLESDLPYHGTDAACTPYKAAVVNSGYTKLPENDADALETALASIGPIAVNVATSSGPDYGLGWVRYGGGIFSGGCTANDCVLDHIVAAVGYDQDYWLVRNSWGASWGEHGYIRLARANDVVTYLDNSPGSGVACLPFPQTQSPMGESGILFDTSYPTDVRAASSSIVV